MPQLIAIIGPTACGKTLFAVNMARHFNGEILSADSRQVYRRMSIGTGKDIEDYAEVPYHLIDIADPGEKYNVYRFQTDFAEAYNDIVSRQRTPILCGGSGLYIEAVLKNYNLLSVPPNPTLRNQLDNKSLAELAEILSRYQKLHNTTDLDNRRRTIRAIEIADYLEKHPAESGPLTNMQYVVLGLDVSRNTRRERISERLRKRLRGGLVEEVQDLLNSGVSADDLIYYGLEYKYVTQYCIGQISYETMTTELEIAIHQFAKRQMTWFRGMERRGITIHWINAEQPMEQMISQAAHLIS